MNNQTEEQWRLQVAKAAAWDEGYAAAVRDLNGFDADGSTTPNPFVIWTDQ